MNVVRLPARTYLRGHCWRWSTSSVGRLRRYSFDVRLSHPLLSAGFDRCTSHHGWTSRSRFEGQRPLRTLISLARTPAATSSSAKCGAVEPPPTRQPLEGGWLRVLADVVVPPAIPPAAPPALFVMSPAPPPTLAVIPPVTLPALPTSMLLPLVPPAASAPPGAAAPPPPSVPPAEHDG